MAHADRRLTGCRARPWILVWARLYVALMVGFLIRCTVAAAIAVAIIAAPVAAQQGGDQNRGAGLALTWCVTCHVIDTRGTGPSYATPPRFPDLARDARTTPDLIRAQLSASHTLMPKMALSDRDKDDLIAYILSLHSRPE